MTTSDTDDAHTAAAKARLRSRQWMAGHAANAVASLVGVLRQQGREVPPVLLAAIDALTDEEMDAKAELRGTR